MSDSFYLTLPSNVKSYDDNTIGSYVTYLPNTLKLDDEWEVGLAEITYTRSWYNICKAQRFTILIDSPGPQSERSLEEIDVEEFIFFLKPGSYTNIQDLCDMINAYLQRCLSETGEVKHVPYLILNSQQGYITQQVGRIAVSKTDGTVTERNVLVHLGNQLEQMLGFTLVAEDRKYGVLTRFANFQKYFDGGYMSRVADHHYDLSGGIHNLMVYSDVVEPSVVGNTYAQFLRSIKAAGEKFGEDINLIYSQPYYQPLASKEIDRIMINIKDDAGEDIKFRQGRVVVVLHFRRKWKAII